MPTLAPFSQVPQFLLDSFWASGNITPRSRQQGLQYAMEGYIHDVNFYEQGKTMLIEGENVNIAPALDQSVDDHFY